MDWQDVMIENFGTSWCKSGYTVSEVGKLAEQIVGLKTQLAKAECKEKGLGYYAHIFNWDFQPGDSNKTEDVIHSSDLWRSSLNMDGTGGRRAREYFQSKEKTKAGGHL